MLTVLHEIGHAWRHATYKDQKQEYENWANEIKALLLKPKSLNIRQLAKKQHWTKEETLLRSLLIDKEELSRLGVESITITINHEPTAYIFSEKGESYDINKQINFTIYEPVFIDGTEKFRKYQPITFHLQIDIEKLIALMTDYAISERDAWADAIKILKFLRRNGFDLEPNLKSNENILGYVHKRLKTYQDSMDFEIQFPIITPPHKEFTRYKKRQK